MHILKLGSSLCLSRGARKDSSETQACLPHLDEAPAAALITPHALDHRVGELPREEGALGVGLGIPAPHRVADDVDPANGRLILCVLLWGFGFGEAQSPEGKQPSLV